VKKAKGVLYIELSKETNEILELRDRKGNFTYKKMLTTLLNGEGVKLRIISFSLLSNIPRSLKIAKIVITYTMSR